MTSMLACGPYFRDEDIVLSLAIFLVCKPAAYFAFIEAFRYRVARPIPMRIGQVVKLTVLRAIVGLAFVGGGALLLIEFDRSRYQAASWVWLYASRLLAWWLIGRFAAGIRGKRLAAWTLFGTIINIGFDLALVGGLTTGFLVPSLVLTAIAVLIAILHKRGRRAALVSRFFDEPYCAKCEYNLTGNLSGICPECGTPVPAEVADSIAADNAYLGDDGIKQPASG